MLLARCHCKFIRGREVKYDLYLCHAQVEEYTELQWIRSKNQCIIIANIIATLHSEQGTILALLFEGICTKREAKIRM